MTNNAGSGLIMISGSNSAIGTIALKNKKIGFDIRGATNTVSNSIALENGKAGFSFTGKEHSVASNLAIENGAQGFVGTIRSSSISSNNAISNKDDGFNFKGGTVDEPNSYDNNIAMYNGGDGVFVGGTNPDINMDGGGNKGLANDGAIQCQIAGLPCQ